MKHTVTCVCVTVYLNECCFLRRKHLCFFSHFVCKKICFVCVYGYFAHRKTTWQMEWLTCLDDLKKKRSETANRNKNKHIYNIYNERTTIQNKSTNNSRKEKPPKKPNLLTLKVVSEEWFRHIHFVSVPTKTLIAIVHVTQSQYVCMYIYKCECALTQSNKCAPRGTSLQTSAYTQTYAFFCFVQFHFSQMILRIYIDNNIKTQRKK